MKEKAMILLVFGILLISAVWIQKEDTFANPNPIKVEWIGEGREHIFRESAILEISLQENVRHRDLKIFVNQRQWEGEWKYGERAKVYCKEEGKYQILIEYKGTCVYLQEAIVELKNPIVPKVSLGKYRPGSWSGDEICISAYGSCAVSGIEKYEYKVGSGRWNTMKEAKISFCENMDELVSVRAVSKAGREGELLKIPVKLWRKSPGKPKVICKQIAKKGYWYQENPELSFTVSKKREGPPADVYFRLLDLSSKDQWTKINQIPKIQRDGNYKLLAWSVDQAGNASERVSYLFCVDTKKPRISIEYEKAFPKNNILKRQKAAIWIFDANLNAEQIQMDTTGRRKGSWKKQGDGYVTELFFEGNKKHHLEIQAEDAAGNQTKQEGKNFETDLIKPQIFVAGVKHRMSYQRAMKLKIKISDDHLDSEATEIFLNNKRWKPQKIRKDGHYHLKITAKDLAGNQKEKSWNFTLNQKGIQIQFLEKGKKGKYVTSDNLKPTFLVESLEPVQVAGFLLNGKKVEYMWKGKQITTLQPVKDDGVYKVQLHLKDINGTKKSSETIHLIYDRKKPSVVIRGLDQKSACEYGTTLEVSLQNRRDRIRIVKIDGAEAEISNNKAIFRRLEPGDHKFFIKAVDEAGNVLRQRIRFTVTRAVPDPVKEILNKTDSASAKKQDRQEKNDFAWLLGCFSIIFLVGMIKKKRTRL